MRVCAAIMIRRWRSLDSIIARQVSLPAFLHSLGQKRKSEATSGMSAPGGEADVIRSKADIHPNSMNRRPFPRLSSPARPPRRPCPCIISQGSHTPAPRGVVTIFGAGRRETRCSSQLTATRLRPILFNVHSNEGVGSCLTIEDQTRHLRPGFGFPPLTGASF